MPEILKKLRGFHQSRVDALKGNPEDSDVPGIMNELTEQFQD